MTNMWREELAWAAGFFDGEGTIAAYFKKGNTNRIDFRLSVYQSERTTLERFWAAILGVGRIHGPYQRKDQKNGLKPFYQYSCGGHRQTQAVVAMLWPFLSKPKKDQIKKAFQQLPLNPSQAGARRWKTRRENEAKAHDLGGL